MRSFVFMTAALLISVGATTARATEFAILIGRDHDHKSGCDITIDPGTFKPGGPLVMQPTLMHIELPASLLDSDKLLSGELNPNLASDVPTMPDGSFIFNLELSDPITGEKFTQFAHPITYTFSTSVPSGFAASDACLASVRAGTQQSTWQIDNVAKSSGNGAVVCTCSHLSTFYFGLSEFVPEPASAIAILSIAPILRRPRRLRQFIAAV